jgi:hypothetical protein
MPDNSSSQQKPEDQLSERILKAKNQGNEITKKASEYQRYGQYISDLANESLAITKYGIPSHIDLDPKLQAWSYVNQQQQLILDAFSIAPLPLNTASAATASYSMLEFTDPDNIVPFVPIEKQPEVQAHVARLSDIIDRQAKNREEILTLLNQYGLNVTTSGRKSPAELFEVAWKAYEKPVTDPPSSVTSLIPMRESINAVIMLLLKLRRNQEKTPNEITKIQSIMRQLAGDTVSPTAIDNLANRWHSLNNELSGSKQLNLVRHEWLAIIRRATLFLLELLQSIDPLKMRPV